MNVFVVLFIISLIVAVDWKKIKEASKREKITVTIILSLSVILSLLPLRNLPGPINLLKYVLKLKGNFS